MLRSAYFVLTACVFLLTSIGWAGGPPETLEMAHLPSDQALDRLVEETRARHDLPALAAVVVRSESVVAISATGIRRNGAEDRVTARDRFHLGSNTKALTATLLAVLVENDALAWDTTPLDLFPELDDSIHPAYRDVTLEQLLAHRSGLPSFTSNEEFALIQRFSGPPIERRHAFMLSVLQQEPAVAPGSEHLYSNAGYAVAAAMAEKVGSARWEELMRDRLFVDLDIAGGFGFPAAVDAAQPSGHFQRGDKFLPSRQRASYEPAVIIGPAGDVNMSLADYGRFLQLHLRGLRGRETAILSASAIQFMHASRGGIRPDSEMPGSGLGWIVHDYRGARMSSHAGSLGRFKARATIHASGDVAVAVVANAGGEAADKATRELRRVLLERYESEQ
jgi:CubicO group peptidase (beta-lactamase class C family)